MPTVNSTTRHVQPGVTRVLHLPAIAAANLTPTRTEITAGTILDPELIDWDGWSSSTSTAPSRAIGTRKVGGKASVETLAESSLTHNASKTGNDVRKLFVQGLAGFVVFMDGGDVVGQLMDVFKTEVIRTALLRSADGSAVVGVHTAFAIETWATDLIIPT